ncbi:putative phage repressor [Acidovorax delafieldii 2AN]|uniref:Putative phage repressor n=2 Tax=Acidovorax delafieldii TaxID=47920 RepID=C5T1S8_ACIDE|nr:putative phage repressor [Acidovorax delafieldii 2AN]
MLSQHLSGHRPISLSAATAYAIGLGVRVEDFSPRLAKAIADAAQTTTVQTLSPSPSPGVPVVHVPLLANAGSMGPGTDIQHDDILVGQIALSEQWVARRLQPTKLNALRFIHAYGDSMSPTFEDGDILLVDTGIKDPKIIDGVYVMAANDRVYIKRVRQRMDGVVEISSDNATVKTVDVLNGDHRIDILGRVVWCWNGRKL